MTELLSSIKKLDFGGTSKVTSPYEDERLWMLATILILSEKAGLVSFSHTKSRKRGKGMAPLPDGLVALLETCEKQGLIEIHRKKLDQLTSGKK